MASASRSRGHQSQTVAAGPRSAVRPGDRTNRRVARLQRLDCSVAVAPSIELDQRILILEALEDRCLEPLRITLSRLGEIDDPIRDHDREVVGFVGQT